MELLVSLAIGVLTGTGVYLMLRARTFPVVLNILSNLGQLHTAPVTEAQAAEVAVARAPEPARGVSPEGAR